MKELVFNIKNIFSTDASEGCLGQYDADKFNIPAYQRGYKWASVKPTDAVQVLMNDLWEAFQSSKNSDRKEYYMQYITVKKIIKENHLEVIDGQQRLTSFSILLSVLHMLSDNAENLVKDKLDYAIRLDFFNEYIYERDKLLVFVEAEYTEGDGLSIHGEFKNNQDIFYLHSAAKYIHRFCNEKIDKDVPVSGGLQKLKEFTEFILSFVKIIVNEVEPHIDSERVFRNLNSNKVPLTEAELIKGLLLTKAARHSSESKKQKHFREILEIRTALGRQWDEIATWVNDKKVKHFFFSNNNKEFTEKSFNEQIAKEFTNESPTQEKALLLLLLSMTFNKDIEIKDSKYLLFNYFHKEIKINNSSLDLLLKLKEIYSILKDRYQDDKIYNLIGYVFFVEGSGENKINYLTKNMYWSKEKLLSELVKDRNKHLPENLIDLKYGDYNKEIHSVLLALNVFETAKEKSEIRFDYYNFRGTKNKWSLEHIFPQSPEGEWRGIMHVLNEEEKVEVLKMIGEKYENIEEVKNVFSLPVRDSEAKAIYYNALQKTGINSLGNMSLLTLPANSSNGCAMFKLKRHNVNEMIQNGSFVPKHTFEIFNKINIQSDSVLKWTKEDADNHFKYIVKIISILKANNQ